MDSRKIDYDRLKNKLYIEKFSGRRRTIIEQDFYSHIFLLNLLIGIKHDAELKNNAKTKRNSKNTPYEYHSNVNTLIGENQRPTSKTPNRQPRRNTSSNPRDNRNWLQRTSSNKNTRTNKCRKR